MRSTYTAATTDADGSEFIDRFEFAGLPDGVVVLGAPDGIYDVPGTPGMQAADFTLVLQPGQDYDFDLSVKAFSKEISNDDDQAAVKVVPIEYESNTNLFSENFLAQNQSIWDTGDQFTFPFDKFVGIDLGREKTLDLGIVFAKAAATIKAGLDVDLLFKGGGIDAHVPIDVTFNTSYNKTTDVLDIDPSLLVTAGGGFMTAGPSGHAKVDFIFKYDIGASVGLDLPIIGEVTVFGVNPKDDQSENLIDLDSANLEFSHDFGLGLTGSIAWPNVTTTGVQSSTDVNSFVSSGQSNDFLHLNADIDQALADIFLGGVNPFDIHIPYDLELVDGVIDVELLDADLFGGLNFVQDFNMLVKDMKGTLTFENNQTMDFNFIDGIQPLANAKSYDVDGDGMIEFGVTLAPIVSLANSTDVTFTVGYNFDVLKGHLTYDAGDIVGSGSESFGPVVDLGGSLDLASVEVFNNDFPLNFQQQNVDFFA